MFKICASNVSVRCIQKRRLHIPLLDSFEGLRLFPDVGSKISAETCNPLVRPL